MSRIVSNLVEASEWKYYIVRLQRKDSISLKLFID